MLHAARSRLGLSAIVLGVSRGLIAVGTAINIDAVSQIGLAVYRVLGPLWAARSGVVLIRERQSSGLGRGPAVGTAL